jgi:hypothetical protein
MLQSDFLHIKQFYYRPKITEVFKNRQKITYWFKNGSEN